MKFTTLFLLAAVLFCESVVFALIREVPTDYDLIQSAIDASSDGDTVLVANGTYYENINFHGRNIAVMSHFPLTLAPGDIWATIIDGSQPIDPDSGSCVHIIEGEDSTAELAGFTITGGTGTPLLDDEGAGVYVEGGGILVEESDVWIHHNLIINNEATRTYPGAVSSGGGGIRVGFGSPRLENNVIMGNAGKYGGGICVNWATPIIRNNAFVRNTGGQDYGGGGVIVIGQGHECVFDNNVVAGNTSVLPGGGIRVFASVLNARNNIVWGNRANSGANQISGAAASVPMIYSCIQGGWTGTGNISDYPEFLRIYLLLQEDSPCNDTGDPDPIYNDAGGTPRNDMGLWGGPLSNSMFLFQCTPSIQTQPQTVNFGEVEIGIPDTAWLQIENRGVGKLTLDSALAAPVAIINFPDTVMPFQTLTIGLIWTPQGDGELEATLQIYHNDSEQPNPYVVVLTGETPVSAENPSEAMPTEFSLLQNYPNPFNPATVIPFALPVDSRVAISIYDLTGRRVETLLNGDLSAGYHSVEWNAESFSAGTYFCKLETESFQKVTKLLLIK